MYYQYVLFALEHSFNQWEMYFLFVLNARSMSVRSACTSVSLTYKLEKRQIYMPIKTMTYVAHSCIPSDLENKTIF